MITALTLPKQWLKPLLGVFFVTLACIWIFWETWISIVSIWVRSETYAHGFVVAPISLWLIWTRRNQFQHLLPENSYIGLFFTGCCGFAWLTANLVHVLVVEQWAVVGVLVCSFWTILGSKIIWNMLFPMMFLFLMVPFGEDFVPLLMEYTATFTVGMLRLTGISVYREGLHFTLASGNWSVIDACSGIRYLIASITLGAVFAYLNYTNYKKRLVFMLAALIVPILANGVRAYMIVMIGHLSDMKLATGVDHLVYGWLFFGIVMMVLFYIGSLWMDAPLKPAIVDDSATQDLANYPFFWGKLLLIVMCFSIWPVLSPWMTAKQGENPDIPLRLRQLQINQWHTVDAPDWGWAPQYTGVVKDNTSYFGKDGSVVAIYLANFGDETKGELINSRNLLITPQHRNWRVLTRQSSTINCDMHDIRVEEAVLDRNDDDLLVFRWFNMGRHHTSNTYYAKWLQLLKRLLGDTNAELLITLYAPTPHGDYQQARLNLQKIAEAVCKSENSN